MAFAAITCISGPPCWPGNTCGVDLLGQVGVAAEDEAAARAGEGLVHGAGDDIRVRDRARVQAGGDQAGEVGHVHPQLGADLVGDGAERGEVELARIGGPAGDEHRRPVLQRLVAHDVHVDEERLRVDSVGGGVVQLAGEVELHAVGEVPAVGEFHAEDGVAGSGDRGEDRGVGGGAGVRLHVRELGAEQGLGPIDRELLCDIDVLASAVVAAPRVALRVLVGEHGPLRLEHGARNEVLAGDHLEVVALAAEFALQHRGDLGIDAFERVGEGGWKSAGGKCGGQLGSLTTSDD